MATGVTATAGVNFDTPPTSGSQTFRLLQSARTWSFNPATNLSDATTDSGGATIKVTWGSSGPTAIDFTLGNNALGVTNQSLPLTTVVLNGKNNARQVTLADGRILTVVIDSEDNNGSDYSWSAFGSWSITSAASVIQNSGAFVTGYETPLAGIPSSGSATFNGFIKGAAFVPNGSNLAVAQLDGTAQLNVNWATGGINGTASSILATPFPLGSQSAQNWNSLTFAGNITSGTTAFSGTTTVTGTPGTAFALTAGATGNLNGQFYGATAQEVGAIWSAHDGTSGATGILLAK